MVFLTQPLLRKIVDNMKSKREEKKKKQKEYYEKRKKITQSKKLTISIFCLNKLPASYIVKLLYNLKKTGKDFELVGN